jgi:hypothetical protein
VATVPRQERPRAAPGVRQSLLGTIRRRDGSRQVTYKGQPLYFYVDDPRGQVLCNGVAEFGGTWYALRLSRESADLRAPAAPVRGLVTVPVRVTL